MALPTIQPSNLVPAEWARRLEAQRRCLHPSRRRELAREFEPFRQRYRHGTTRLRQSLNTARLQQPELAPLERLGRQALELARLLYEELCHVDLADKPVSSSGIVSELVVDWETRIERLCEQLWLVEHTHRGAEELHAILDELLHGSSPMSLRLERVTEHLLPDNVGPCSVHVVLPVPGVSLTGSLQREHWNDAWLYVQALQSARWLDWLLRERILWQDRRQILLAAALLQDCGVLLLKDKSGGGRIDERHPTVGAALLGGLTESSADLPLLVAEHHDRLNAGGLSGRVLAPEARLLAVVVRFVELLEEQAPADEFVDESQSSHPAVEALIRQTRRGALDPEFTRWIAEAVDPSLATEIPPHPSGIARRDPMHSLPESPHLPRSADVPQETGTPPPSYRVRSRSGRRKVLIPFTPASTDR